MKLAQWLWSMRFFKVNNFVLVFHNYLPFLEKHSPLFEEPWIFLNWGFFVWNLVEIGQLVLKMWKVYRWMDKGTDRQTEEWQVIRKAHLSLQLRWVKSEMITFFSDSQVFVNQFLNLALVIHSMEFVRLSRTISNCSSEQEWAQFLNMARTFSLCSPKPFSVLLTHLVQLCSRWKSQRNTKLSITRIKRVSWYYYTITILFVIICLYIREFNVYWSASLTSNKRHLGTDKKNI